MQYLPCHRFWRTNPGKIRLNRGFLPERERAEFLRYRLPFSGYSRRCTRSKYHTAGSVLPLQTQK